MAKQPKMVPCKNCKREIPANAKTCPYCGIKITKPVYKRVWFWIVIVVALIVVIGVIGGGSGSEGDSKKIGEVNGGQSETQAPNSAPAGGSSETEAPAQPTEEVQTVYHVGDILHDGEMDIVYMASGDYAGENQFTQPAEGNKYIFLQFAFINTSKNANTGISFYSFECYADGYSCDAYYGGDDDLSATLSAGRATSGYVYFEVPADAKEIEVEYETNFFTEEKITFVFEGDKDSGYVLEKNTAATEGALQVGDAVESSSLNITYLSCFEDSSDNPFITPKDGYHYITCELEFENVSDSDESITYFSFNCYADGINCSGAYFRDDAISATLSAGRKAKGTVTFEVPLDATVIEVEFITNYWTSNRVVFNAATFE